jgi:hypothetical protein
MRAARSHRHVWSPVNRQTWPQYAGEFSDLIPRPPKPKKGLPFRKPRRKKK